ncbi:hypothetical protein D3C80_1531780 [compost metagenome]
MLRVFEVFIGSPDDHRHTELLRRGHFTRRTMQMRVFTNGFAMVGRVKHDSLLIAHLVDHAVDKGIGVQHRVVIGVNQALFGAELIHAHAFRLITSKAARVAL